MQTPSVATGFWLPYDGLRFHLMTARALDDTRRVRFGDASIARFDGGSVSATAAEWGGFVHLTLKGSPQASCVDSDGR